MCAQGKHVCQNYRSFITNDSSEVYDSLLGISAAHPHLVVLEGFKIILRRDHHSMTGKVKILAGGGAGLEPSEIGCIGRGMLTAAVFGDVLVAPSAHSILVAIRELAFEHNDGILLLVKNYIGDLLNFGLAFERAVKENILIKMLLIGDDVSNSEQGNFGRRGLAGSILVYKIAGAMAEAGKSLDDIFNLCRESILTDLSTISISILTSGYIKGGSKSLTDKEEKVVVGLGAYGQPGKQINYRGLNELIDEKIDAMINPSSLTNVVNDEPFVLLINNMGGTSKLEEGLICAKVMNKMASSNITVARFYSDTFMSLLDTKGFSITLLKITDPETVVYLDAPTLAFSWPKSHAPDMERLQSYTVICETGQFDKPNNTVSSVYDYEAIYNDRYSGNIFGPSVPENISSILGQIILFAAEALMSCEKQINVIDAEIGDGDAGSMLKRGASVIIQALQENQINLVYPYNLLQDLADLIDKNTGGTTGALYSIFFRSASSVFPNIRVVNRQSWCEAFKAGVKAVKFYGKAEVGERTILDVLCPAADAFERAVQSNDDLHRMVSSIASTCEYCAEKTKSLKPRYVRGHYPQCSLFYPDAGAHAAAVWIRAIAEGVKLRFPTE